LRSIASLEFVFVWRVRARAVFSITFHGHDHGSRAPRIWTFLNSLKSLSLAKEISPTAEGVNHVVNRHEARGNSKKRIRSNGSIVQKFNANRICSKRSSRSAANLLKPVQAVQPLRSVQNVIGLTRFQRFQEFPPFHRLRGSKRNHHLSLAKAISPTAEGVNHVVNWHEARGNRQQ